MKLKKLLFCVVIIVILVFGLSISALAIDFPDVNESNWFYDVVNSGVDSGYICGYPDGTFKPNDYVTYGEFYKMVAIAAGLDISSSDTSHWAIPYAKAVSYNGENNAIMYPYGLKQDISRKEAIRTLMISFGVNNAINSRYFDNVPFSDMPNNTIYCYDGHIMNAYNLGIITGYNGQVNPENSITRAEAVAIIERALNVEDWTVPEPVILNNLTIMYKGNDAESFKEDICKAIEKIPEHMILQFIKDGIEIIITDESPSAYYSGKINSDLCGIYNSNTKQIVIFTYGKSSSALFEITNTFIHEFGHYVSYNMLSYADKVSIMKIYQEGTEKEALAKILNNNYCKTNVEEFWAELFTGFACNKVSIENVDIAKSLSIVEKYF